MNAVDVQYDKLVVERCHWVQASVTSRMAELHLEAKVLQGRV